MNGAQHPPFADYLLRQLDELARTLGGPVRSKVLADMLGIPLRTLQWYAARLESAGRVTRRSPRSGWLPATYAIYRAPDDIQVADVPLDGPSNVTDVLNTLGAEGWELVTVQEMPVPGRADTVNSYLLKRPAIE